MTDLRAADLRTELRRRDVASSLRSLAAPVLLVAFLVLTTGCASTNLTPISAIGASYEPLPDEAGTEADFEAEKLVGRLQAGGQC